MKPYIAWVAFGAIALDAAAEQTAAPNPADAAARVPQTTYRSAFEGYVPYREQTLAPWREINDEVGRIGGHGGIFRGATQGAHGHQVPTKPAAGAAATKATEAGGQAPARGAPKAPAAGTSETKPGGGHHGH